MSLYVQNAVRLVMIAIKEKLLRFRTKYPSKGFNFSRGHLCFDVAAATERDFCYFSTTKNRTGSSIQMQMKNGKSRTNRKYRLHRFRERKKLRHQTNDLSNESNEKLFYLSTRLNIECCITIGDTITGENVGNRSRFGRDQCVSSNEITQFTLFACSSSSFELIIILMIPQLVVKYSNNRLSLVDWLSISRWHFRHCTYSHILHVHELTFHSPHSTPDTG